MACAQCRRSDLWSPSNHFAFVLKLRQVLTFEPGPLYPYTTQPHSGRSPVVATRFINRSLPAVKSSGVWVQLGKKAIYAIIVLGDNGCFYSASFIDTIPAVIRKLPITSVVCGWGHHSRTPWFTTCHKSRLLTVNSGWSSFLRYIAGTLHPYFACSLNGLQHWLVYSCDVHTINTKSHQKNANFSCTTFC